jgi:F-type H+-transporting ATPase subunit delta
MSMSAQTTQDEISKRYGGVLFELAQETKQLGKITQEIEIVKKQIGSQTQDWQTLTNPTIPVKVQLAVMTKWIEKLKLSPLMTHFIFVVTRNYRLKNLFNILGMTQERVHEAEGRIQGTIETAVKLSKSELEAIQKVLKAQLKKDIHMREDINEDLLGGTILRIGSIMVDASLKTQLNKLQQVMKG